MPSKLTDRIKYNKDVFIAGLFLGFLIGWLWFGFAEHFFGEGQPNQRQLPSNISTEAISL